MMLLGISLLWEAFLRVPRLRLPLLRVGTVARRIGTRRGTISVRRLSIRTLTSRLRLVVVGRVMVLRRLQLRSRSLYIRP